MNFRAAKSPQCTLPLCFSLNKRKFPLDIHPHTGRFYTSRILYIHANVLKINTSQKNAQYNIILLNQDKSSFFIACWPAFGIYSNVPETAFPTIETNLSANSTDYIYSRASSIKLTSAHFVL